jgi:hypothetical protein
MPNFLQVRMILHAISPRFTINMRLMFPHELICWSKVFRGNFATGVDAEELAERRSAIVFVALFIVGDVIFVVDASRIKAKYNLESEIVQALLDIQFITRQGCSLVRRRSATSVRGDTSPTAGQTATATPRFLRMRMKPYFF